MYALLKPDGSFHRIVREDLPGGSTDYAAFGVVPVNDVVPEGYSRNGWQIVNGVCEPVLVEIPEPGLPPVPFEVGSGQIRAALVALGWVTIQNPSNADAEVDAWAAALIELAVQDPGQKAIALLLWRNASAFKRNNPFILLVATILGKTGEETDTLFRTAVNF